MLYVPHTMGQWYQPVGPLKSQIESVPQWIVPKFYSKNCNDDEQILILVNYVAHVRNVQLVQSEEEEWSSTLVT